MGWRTICIGEASRLCYKLNSLGVVLREEIVWISLDEIDVVIIESLMCNVTIKLLAEFANKGINVVICDESHMPVGNFISVYDNIRSVKYNKIQLEWKKEIKQKMWQKIVKHKILLQMIVLYKHNKNDKIEILKKYIEEVENGDLTNREGLAAKVYFHELFGLDFIRKRNADDIINSSLNYVYQIIRSKISQEIISHGYIPSLGIFHCSEYNYYGLADDLIEVYRPIVDNYVINLLLKEDISFMTSIYKEKLLQVLYIKVLYNNTKQKLIESIKLYVISLTNAMSNNKENEVIFPYLEDDDK